MFLDDVRWSLAGSNEAAADIQAVYVEVLGRLASDDDVLNQQAVLAGGTSLADLRVNTAKSTEATRDITAICQSLLNRPPSPDELAGYQRALGAGGGWTLQAVAPAVADAAINGFYQSVFARNARPDELDAIKGGTDEAAPWYQSWNGRALNPGGTGVWIVELVCVVSANT